MRRTLARITITAAVTVGLAATSYVQALGLGEIDVSSNLNQRFIASIPLTDISAEDLETVTVTLAPNEAFERAGIERAEYLSSLNFEIKNDRGTPRVVVSSNQIAREPVLDLLIQARWKGGKIQRDYTILLDPAEAIARPVVAPSAVQAPVIASTKPAAKKPATPSESEFYETPVEVKPAAAPKAPIVKPSKSLPTPAPVSSDAGFDSATGTYGPVAPKETLWSIAAKLRPSAAVTMDQMLLALSEANPVTIQRGTTVSQGATLRVPTAERIQATPAAEAKAKLAALRGGKAPVSAKPATALVKKPATEKALAPKTAETSKAKPAIAPAPEPAAPAPNSTASSPVIASAAPVQPKPQATPAVEAAAAPAAVVPATPVAAEPAPAETPAATTTPEASPATAPSVPAVVPAAPVAKSPLAQPLPESESPGFLSEYGLPLVVGLLVILLGIAAWALSRRRKSTGGAKDFTKFNPGDTASVIAPAGGAGALGRLGEKGREQAPVSRANTMAAAAAATQQMTQPVESSPAMSASHQSTLILDPEAVASLNNAVKQSAVTGGSDSFDKTAQVQVETLQINLSDNDPLSEADFHLAYGLYDEAIVLLKTATQQQPQRTDLKVKLAETYFAAGRPMEFQEISEDLKPRLSAAEWSKLAIMGSQICPDVALFQSDGGDAGLDADFDLAFDEPSAPEPVAVPAKGASIDFALTPTPAVKEPTFSMPSASKLSLDDDLDDDVILDKKSQPPAGLDDDASIDFMLGQSLTPLGAGTRVPDVSDLSFNLGSPKLNVDIPKLDSGRAVMDPASSMPSLNDRATLTPTPSLSLSLQDLEVSITPRQATAESADDELNTKLDLARAYVEMGDNDMARSLLQEVQAQGGDRHQQEAASLLQRLPAA